MPRGLIVKYKKCPYGADMEILIIIPICWRLIIIPEDTIGQIIPACFKKAVFWNVRRVCICLLL